MWIRKYDFDYGRRALMEKLAIGAGAGVLAPLWPTITSAADVSKAYPDELMHVEAATKGKVKVGDVVDANNVDAVKNLLDPITFRQIKEHGRKINIVAPVTDVSELMPWQFMNVSVNNKGKAILGKDGNVYDKTDGTPWAGGAPFLDAKTGNEAIANLTLSWGRHDYCQYAITEWDLDPDGEVAYTKDFVWAELQVTARLDGTVFDNKKDILRFQSVWFTGPDDIAGSSFLSNWYYDQRKYPDLYGYLPAFRRVRQFPTNQRFEPLLPGITWFLSDAWAAGDPMLTWGDYQIVGRQPMLGAVSQNWHGSQKNWEPQKLSGGKSGKTFFETNFSMCPECIVLDAKPTGYPRAPVSKKRIWIDVRNMLAVGYITYDRRGQEWKSFEAPWSQMKDGNTVSKDASGHPDWTWACVHSHDIQSNRMSRALHSESCAGGYTSEYGAHGVDVYNKYLTPQAITRLGKV